METDITTRRIDELLAFLPKFTVPDRKFIQSWGGGTQDKNGVWLMPWPIYEQDVEEFFRLASAECWADYDYIPEQGGKLLDDSSRIKNASLSEIKSMLTYCVRGERFCSGHWGAMLEEGKITAILNRLREIRERL